MPDLTSRLIVDIKDNTGKGAKSAAQNVKGISDELKKLEKVKGFKGVFDDFASSRSRFAEAKRQVQELATQIAKTKATVGGLFDSNITKKNPLFGKVNEVRQQVKSLERQFSAAKREVKSAADDFEKQRQRITTSWRDVDKLSFSGLINKENELKAAIERTTASIEAQKKAATTGFDIVSSKPFGPPRPPGLPPAVGTAPMAPRRSSVPPVRSEKSSSGIDFSGAIRSNAAGYFGGLTALDAGKYIYETESLKNKMEARGGWSRSDVNSFASFARRQAMETGLAGQSGPAGMFQMGEIYGKAGLSQAAARGSLLPTLRFARYGDISDEEAANTIVRGATVFNLPLDTVSNSQKSATRIADVMAYTANKTIADVSDISAAFKYAAPMAYAMGMSPEQLSAFIGTMVQRGNRGDEAGIAMRSALVRTVKPTKGSNQAMAELGLTFGQFATSYRDFAPSELAAGVSTRFGQGPAFQSGVEKFAGSLSSGMSAEEKRKAVTEYVMSKSSAKTPQDKEIVAQAIQEFFASQIAEMDVEGLLAALGEKKATAGHMARIFDQRQAARLLPLLDNKDYNTLLNGLNTEAPGAAARGASVMMQGVVGEWSKLVASLQDLVMVAGDAGVIRGATQVFGELSGLMREVSAIGKMKIPGLGKLDDFTPGNAATAMGATWLRDKRRAIFGLMPWESDAPMGTSMDGNFGGKSSGVFKSMADQARNINEMTLKPNVDISSIDLLLMKLKRVQDAITAIGSSTLGTYNPPVQADTPWSGGIGFGY